MRINNVENQNSFKGYGARPLGGLFFNYADKTNLVAAQEVTKIVKDLGCDVFLNTGAGIIKNNFSKNLTGLDVPHAYPWVQDSINFLPDNSIIYGGNSDLGVRTFLDNFKKNFTSVGSCPDVAGGNFFIIEKDGKLVMLAGSELYNGVHNKAKDFGVEKIEYIGQPDFHIDLAVRPLKGKDILVADDNLTLQLLDQAAGAATRFLKHTNDLEVNEFLLKLVEYKREFVQYARDYYKSSYRFVPMENIISKLQKDGYNPIRVPGRLYTFNGKSLIHHMNYMNAVVHEKPNGDLVYITNDDDLDRALLLTEDISEKIKFSFKNEFMKNLKGYIKPENVHFISADGRMPAELRCMGGGIHCMCAEMPYIPERLKTSPEGVLLQPDSEDIRQMIYRPTPALSSKDHVLSPGY